MVAPEDILEDLWPGQEYVNPRDAVKNLVYRLKQKLETQQVPAASSVVNCSFGCYGWNNSIPYWLDARAFEELTRQARVLAETDSLKAVAAYREALLCKPNYFCFLCKLEKRRAKRDERPLYLGLLTLTGPDYQVPP